MNVKCFGFLAASLAIATLVAGGCGQSKPSSDNGNPSAVPEKPKSPEERLYEQVRSGSYQLASALEALQNSKSLTPSLAGTIDDGVRLATKI